MSYPDPSWGLYQCLNCHGPSDGPGWCKTCRAGILRDAEFEKRAAAVMDAHDELLRRLED